ncbi:DUF3293 domain-containing protein [Alcaligenaceae bacterium CGII-47]|nr:DUF3293 domain-containing protein [Alcaligenaceae bacterium CGII-47]
MSLRPANIMPKSTNAQDVLQQAYLDAHYIVDTEPPFTLFIGQVCRPLATLYLAHDVDCCAYLTAYNPRSQRLDTALNVQRQCALMHDVQKIGRGVIEGRSLCPDGAWPTELSVLALGIKGHVARELGRKYEQNAIVLAGPAAIPELVWL